MEIPAVLDGAPAAALKRRNQRLTLQLALVALAFAGFGFALVPLYDVICRVTGLNGRTNAMALPAPANTQVDTSRWTRVEFLGHTMPGVGLDFAPREFATRVHPGALTRVDYVVTNTTDRVVVGRAVPSVTPAVAAPHFRKVECFCFSEQTFQPGETRVLPVVFVVDPQIDAALGTVTLSYAFFEAPRDPKPSI